MNRVDDLFDPQSVGPLDIIIHAVLVHLGLTPYALGSNVNERSVANAQLFVNQFVGTPIQAIKTIRAVSGLGLKDAKDAWDQAVSTYIGTDRYHTLSAKAAAERGDLGAVRFHLAKVQ